MSQIPGLILSHFMVACLGAKVFAGIPDSLPPTGLLPPTDEERAWFEANSSPITFPDKVLKDLPSRVVNLEHLPPVRTQIIGSCASWSVVYYVKGWQEAKEHGITRPFPEEHVLSPAFVFQWVGISASDGSSFESNFRFLERHGTTTFEEFPESRWLMQEDIPSIDLWMSAARRRSAPDSLGHIPTNTEDGLSTLKAWLVGGELASTAVGVYTNFDYYPSDPEGVNNNVFFREGTTGWRANHAITIIGYDDDITYHNGTEQRQGAFLAVNSWGTTWGVPAVEGGERGYIWIAYEYFLNNIGAPQRYSFYTMQNRMDYEPRHFAIIDMFHPRRMEISLGLQAGQRDELLSGVQLMPPSGGPRSLDAPIAVDITEHVNGDEEVFWVRVFDVIVPELGAREPASIRGITIVQQDRPPLPAAEGLPLHPRNQLELGQIDPEWIPISPTRRHEEIIPPGGLLISEGATYISADVGDIFGDGKPDIVALGELLRMENGKPVSHGNVYIGEYALGDYDNDGLPDLAVRSSYEGVWDIRIYRNRGNGRFAEESILPPVTHGTPFWVDFNGNGRMDLALLTGSESILLLNMGGGVFRNSGLTLPNAPNWTNMIVDFDQDGLTDWGGWRNLGNGQWQAPPWPETATLAWGDQNANGLLDAAVAFQGGVSLYRNNGDGTFTLLQDDLPGLHSPVVRWADVNNSGRLDLVVRGNPTTGHYISTEGRVMVLLQEEDGTFRDTGLAIHGHGLMGSLLVTDFDGDGDADFVSGGYPSVRGTSFSASVPREVRYTENLYGDDGGRGARNEPPAAPTNLRSELGTTPGAVTLMWADAVDDLTPSRAMRYQLRVGTIPGAGNIVSPAMSLAEFPPRRLSPDQPGQRLQGLREGSYHWSVRAVDATGSMSPWSTERGFVVYDGADPESLFDPNRDGFLDAADIPEVAGLVGSNSPTDLLRADIDGTGTITENDVSELARLLLGGRGAPTPPWMGQIDHAGGVLELEDTKVVIPPGAIVGEPANMRLEKLGLMPFGTGNDYDHEPYRLSGIPHNLEKPIEVSIRNPKWWEPGWENPHLAVGEMGYAPSTGKAARRYKIIEPDYTEDYVLHFRIEPSDEDTRSSLRTEDFVEGTYSSDYWVIAGYSYYTTPNFQIAFPRSYDTETVEQLANDLEQARNRFGPGGLGFSYAARTKWPMAVTLKDLGATTYGYSYSSARGHNHGGLEFNTRLMGDAAARRVTAFHEFFHAVEAFYDPRNRVSIAVSMGPHYTLSEMAATWAEELAVSNPASYAPSEWHAHRFAPFEEWGLDPPKDILSSSRNAGAIAAHGYGWSAMIRYLAQRQGNSVAKDIFEYIRRGYNQVDAISGGASEPSFLWFHRFMISYTLGEVYPFSNTDRQDAIGANRLYIGQTNLSRNFTNPMRNLSARLYGVNVSRTAHEQGFIKPEHRVGFRLEAPSGGRLSIISQKGSDAPQLVEIVPWEDDVSRYITGSAHPVLSEPDGYYFALVTHDKYSPRHAEPEEFNLFMAVVEDQTLVIDPIAFPGLPFFEGTFPPISSTGGTVFVPAAANTQIVPLSGLPTSVVYGVVWEDENAEFEVSHPVTFPVASMDAPGGGYTWSLASVGDYELNLLERRGPNPEDLITVQTMTSHDGTFKFKPHVYEGRMEWSMSISYTVTSTNTVTGDITYHPATLPVVFFVADAL